MTWFKDQYGNLIGVTEIEAVYSYGVITSLRYAANVADNATDGTAKVIANVTYVDGTTNTITVSKVEGLPVAYSYNNVYFGLSGNYFYATPDYAVNEKEDAKTTGALANSQGNYINGHLMRFETLSDGTVSVKKVADTSGTHTQVIRTQDAISYGLLYTTAGANTTIKVDANTKFLVRGTSKNADGTYTYTPIAGVKDFAKYTKKAATVDYVLNATGDYASVVYIVGDSDASETKGFAFIVGSEYNTPVKDGDVEYYVVTLYTLAENGTDKETVKVKKADWDKEINSTTHAKLGETLIANTSYGKLFYLTYTDGYVTAAQQITFTAAGTAVVEQTCKAGEIFAVGYNNTKAADNKYKAAFGAEILTLPGFSCHVYEDITPVVGSLDNLADKVIYVVYNEKHEVLKVYVVDNDAEQSSNVADWVSSADGYDYKVTGKANGKNVGELRVQDVNTTIAQLIANLQKSAGNTATIKSGSYTYTTESNGLLTPVLVNASANTGVTVESFLANLEKYKATATPLVIEDNYGVYTVVAK